MTEGQLWLVPPLSKEDTAPALKHPERYSHYGLA